MLYISASALPERTWLRDENTGKDVSVGPDIPD
jgi:hypothetical protein